jgi:CHAT domain-containing protein
LEYTTLRRGTPLDFDEVKTLLPPALPPRKPRATERKVILVEYFLTVDTAYVFCVDSTREECQVETVPLDTETLRGYVMHHFGDRGGVHRAYRDLHARHGLVKQGLEESWHAYDSLIAPIANWARASERPGESDIVYLIPHGLLHYLPLHALKIDGRYLMERHAVLYAPSASVLKYCQAKRKNNPDGSPARGKAVVFGDSRGDLPYSREEAKNLAGLFGVGPLLTDAVTPEAFRRGVRDADIIHFAGHGYFASSQALDSGLCLADKDVLTARQIFTMEGLRAHLVTLSGCETGVNKERPGDELIGLTRAFLYAGTPSVLVSLWKVADDSTAFLMSRFYQYLLENPAGYKVDALCQAMFDTRARPQWESLYYWAPFVLVGDWQ